MATHQPIVKELINLLTKGKDWKTQLKAAIQEANEKAASELSKEQFARYQRPPVSTLNEYYDYLDWFVTWGPQEIDYDNSACAAHLSVQYNKEVFFQLCRFYWILDQPSGRLLQKQKAFRNWMVDFANDWGNFLNTPESFNEESLDSFINDPDFKMDQYMMPPKAYTPRGKTSKANGPSGWLTFNQFFAREMNPGLRPVAGMFEDSIIVSPADSTFKSKFNIDDDSEVTIKYTHTYNIETLLDGSPYKDRFRKGLFMHSFLGPNDYHRFHAPVRGTVLESRAIQERVFLDVVITDGEFDAPDGAENGYEFVQTRGVLILDSPIGLVAVIPIGMAQVSSVNMPAVEGSYLNKGDEFGYFLFGGSDIIMLFEASSNVTVNAAPTIHYNSGMCIGEVIK